MVSAVLMTVMDRHKAAAAPADACWAQAASYEVVELAALLHDVNDWKYAKDSHAAAAGIQARWKRSSPRAQQALRCARLAVTCSLSDVAGSGAAQY